MHKAWRLALGILGASAAAACDGSVAHLAECDAAIERSLAGFTNYTRSAGSGTHRKLGARYVVDYSVKDAAGVLSNATAVCAFDGGAAIITTNTIH
jgi:hypothetical protein